MPTRYIVDDIPDDVVLILPSFLEAMEDLMKLGFWKHGSLSFQAKIAAQDFTRTPRLETREILKHSLQHWNDYQFGVLHDVYKTRRHQLAADACNAMMEFYFCEKEELDAEALNK